MCLVGCFHLNSPFKPMPFPAVDTLLSLSRQSYPSSYMESIKPNKYGVIYSTPLPDKFFQTPEGLSHGMQMEPVDLTVNKRSSPPSAGGSPSSLKFQAPHRRASPGLSLPSSSPPAKKYSPPPPPGVQPFSVPLSMPPVMAAALSRHGGIRSPGILPVIQPVVVQPVPFMYTSHLQQPLMVSLSEEMENSSSSMQGNPPSPAAAEAFRRTLPCGSAPQGVGEGAPEAWGRELLCAEKETFRVCLRHFLFLFKGSIAGWAPKNQASC